METITLNRDQQRRGLILSRLSAGSITKADAERLLGLSKRQVNRLVRDFDARGLPSLIHGNAGRTPANKVPVEYRERITSLAGKEAKYHGLNTCHLSDLLAEFDQMSLGRSTLYRMLCEDGIIEPSKRKQQPRRKRRERSSQEGHLVQIDGSSHDWLCGRGPKMTLIGGIDDATGKIVSLLFRPTEDQAGYLMLLRSMAKDHGLPECLYHDKHTILRSPKEPTLDDELAGKEPQSQVQRVMSELGITSIPAHSPQAKGRIERLWQTLQDRLIHEMTLAGIANRAEANAFLPGFSDRFNKRFSCESANPDPAWVELEPDTDMAYHFSTCESRVVRQDHTIAWEGKVFQILSDADRLVTAGKRIDVHVTPEENVYLYSGKHRLRYKIAQPVKRASGKKPSAKQAKPADPKSLARRRAWLHGNAA
jgi:transposase